MRVLGVDPGLTRCGVGVVEGVPGRPCTLVAYYVIYTTYLVLDATEHAALPAFTAAITWFVLPLTGLTLAVVLTRAWRRPG